MLKLNIKNAVTGKQINNLNTSHVKVKRKWKKYIFKEF